MAKDFFTQDFLKMACALKAGRLWGEKKLGCEGGINMWVCGWQLMWQPSDEVHW